MLALAHLQRLDRENALGEHTQTWALIGGLSQALAATALHLPASSAARVAEVHEALRTGDYEGASALLRAPDALLALPPDRLALDLAQVTLDEHAGDYASALVRLRAVQATLAAEQGLLKEALFRTAAVLEHRLTQGTGAAAPGGEHASSSSFLGLPAAYALEAAYPNPFTGGTMLLFALPEAACVEVSVYDLLGRRVAVLSDGPFEPGRHAVVLDGGALASGVYVVRAVMAPEGGRNAEVFTQRVTVLR